MHNIDSITRPAVGIAPEATLRQAAALMESSGVGSVAVIDHQRLIGIVTDRDLVRRALARDLPSDSRIDAVMSSPVVTIDADDDLHEAFALFRTNAVRRLAVVRGGEFLGTVTVDDLLVFLAADFSDLARPVTAELLFAHHDAAVPSTR